jgi:hypothetical protein
VWLYGCRSCERTPLALQGKEALKEGGLPEENKEIRDLGCCPSKHPPLALWGKEALEEGDPLRENEDNQREGQELVSPASDWRENHSDNTTRHEDLCIAR